MEILNIVQVVRSVFTGNIEGSGAIQPALLEKKERHLLRPRLVQKVAKGKPAYELSWRANVKIKK